MHQLRPKGYDNLVTIFYLTFNINASVGYTYNSNAYENICESIKQSIFIFQIEFTFLVYSHFISMHHVVCQAQRRSKVKVLLYFHWFSQPEACGPQGQTALIQIKARPPAGDDFIYFHAGTVRILQRTRCAVSNPRRNAC